MQDACKLGGYVQEGRGGPAGSSHTQPAVPTEALRSVDKLLRSKSSHAKCCDRVIVDEQMYAHLLFGGGLGLGVPVVSYAPRPMIISVWEEVLVIIVKDVRTARRTGQHITSQGACMAECRWHKG